jgi:VWFA-related protein
VPFSVMLALDTSSMAGAPLRDLADGARAALTALRSDDRAALLAFQEIVRPATPWTADRVALLSALADLHAAGSTRLFDAAAAAIVQRDREPGRRNLLILFSAGQDTASWLSGFAVLDLVSRTDTVVYTVTTDASAWRALGPLQWRSGIRLSARQPITSSINFLADLAKRTGGELLTSGTSALRRTFERIVLDFRSRYVLTYMPRGVNATGWHPIEVKLTKGARKVTARRGYQRGPDTGVDRPRFSPAFRRHRLSRDEHADVHPQHPEERAGVHLPQIVDRARRHVKRLLWPASRPASRREQRADAKFLSVAV